MPPQARPWFRFYVEAVGDPKMRELTPAQRWLWVGVLAASRRSPTPGLLLIHDGVPMTEAGLATFCGVTTGEVKKALPILSKLGMLTQDESGAWRICNWQKRQYESDNSADRTSRYRHNKDDVTPEHGHNEVTTSGDVTPPESREQNTEAASKSLTHDPPTVDPAAAVVDEALAILAERRLAAKIQRGEPIANPTGLRKATITGLRSDHAVALADPRVPKFETAKELAEWLEPPVKRKSDPLESTAAAQAKNASLNDAKQRPLPPIDPEAGARLRAVKDEMAERWGQKK